MVIYVSIGIFLMATSILLNALYFDPEWVYSGVRDIAWWISMVVGVVLWPVAAVMAYLIVKNDDARKR